MRRILIDTDTASDDAVAIIAALRDPNIHVEAITVVAGNVPIDLAVKNALISVETAQTYAPPVYQGVAKPMMRALSTSEYVHGQDGMGDMDLPAPSLTLCEGHAIDKIIEIIHAYPHEIELVTLGPLTNIALAYLKDPEIATLLKRVVVMGGQGLGPGNITPVAEFNFYVDAEAVHIVLNSGMPLLLVGWDVSTDETFINQSDIDSLNASGSSIAQFCVRCNQTLREHNAEYWNKIGFDLPDPVTMMVALYPEIITDQFSAYCTIEYKSADTYGQLIIDRYGLLKLDRHALLQRPVNAQICAKIDAVRFKQLLFERIK